MEHPTGDPSVAARIITAELLRCLDRDPTFAGRVQPWIRRIHEWPGKVVPDNADQIRAAVLTLITRTRWPHGQLRELIHLLTPLYQGGWCNDAIIHALDRNPDGTRAMPWHDGEGKESPRGELIAFLDKRLRRWRSADPDSLATSTNVPPSPVLATTFQSWASRMHTVYGEAARDQAARPATGADVDQARQAYDRNRRHRGTPLGRVQARTQRQEDVDAGLRKLGGTIAADQARDQGLPVDPDDDLVLLADRDVHHAVITLAAANKPERRHVDQLRAAVRNARLARTTGNPHHRLVTTTELAELAAAVTRADGTAVHHDALRQLLQRVR